MFFEYATMRRLGKSIFIRAISSSPLPFNPKLPQINQEITHLPTFPGTSLSELGIQDCNEAVLRSRLELPSLTKLRIHSMLGHQIT